MNIQVRVMARNAQTQFAALQRQVGGLNVANVAAAQSASRIGGAAAIGSLRKWGSQLQWAGRQLEYNFTLPLVLAGALATKFALDNERAMVRVRKVYGDASISTAQMKAETDALAKSFRVLSDEYGVQQSQVINIAADWAAAGVSGAALGKVTKTTLETMILGEMDAADATKALISIQSQYRLSTGQLSSTIDLLNMVENQTGTSMQDLIVVMSKSAGSARTAGVDIRHLAAMTAALVPAAGSAANAGNALKTIFSRVLAPTKQASDLMKRLGINTDTAAWSSLNATDRLKALAQKFNSSTQAQKAFITTTIFGRYQLNRSEILLRALTDGHTYLTKALDATKNPHANFVQREKELNQVLESQPQQLKQLGVQLQNMAADIIGPLVPLIIALANGIKHAVHWFTELDPSVQKLIGTLLILLATMGPIVRYIGAIALMISFLGRTVLDLAKILLAPFRLLGALVIELFSLMGTAVKGLYGLMSPVIVAIAKLLWSGLGVLPTRIAVMFTAAMGAIGSALAALGASMLVSLRIIGVSLLSTLIAPLERFAQFLLAYGARVILPLIVMPIQRAVTTSLLFLNLLAVKSGIIFKSMMLTIARTLAPLALLVASPFLSMFTFVTRMSGLWLASLGNLFGRGLTYIQLAFWRMGQGIILIMNGVMTPIMAAWTAVLGFLGRTTALAGTALTTLWAGVMRVFAVVTEVGGAVVSRVWAFFMVGLPAIMSRVGVLLVTGWARFLTLMGAVTTTLGAAFTRLWAVIGTALVTIWEFTSRGIALIWTRTLLFIAGGGLYRIIVRSFALLGGSLLTIMSGIGRGLLTALISPWGIAILAVVALISAFRNKIAAVWNSIADGAAKLPSRIATAFRPVVQFFQTAVQHILNAFNALPVGVKNAIMAVVSVVAAAAKQVYEWFSYLNPFAHHSPSLVENVTTGMNVVRGQHTQTNKSTTDHTKAIKSAHQDIVKSTSTNARSVQQTHKQVAQSTVTNARTVNSVQQHTQTSGTSGVGSSATSGASDMKSLDSIINKATADVARFRAASKGMIPSEWADNIKAVKSQFPTLLPMFLQLIKEYDALNARLATQKAAVDAQQKVVDTWKTKLDASNAALTIQQDKLDGLQKTLDKSQAQYDAAQQSMQDYANAPIKGMQAFNDKIFENSEAQKKVQLQMDLWEQKNGSLDKLNDKFSKLNGEISDLQGQAAALRSKGAGSDILGPITAQIDALQKQAGAVQATIKNSPVDDLQAQMDKLSKQGDILQLQNDIKFDPLEHQIQKLSNTTKELSYKDIVAGITSARSTMDALTPTIKTQTDAVSAQQKVVDQATASRDRLQKRYDIESAKLDALQATYQKTADAISAIKDALDSVSSAATTAEAKLKSAAGKSDAFGAAGLGNFAEPGGKTGTLGHVGGVDDINKFTADEQKRLGNMMGKFDMFEPIKKMWSKFATWWKANISPVLHSFGQMFTAIFQTIGNAIASFTHSDGASGLGKFFQGAFGVVGKIIRQLVLLFKLFWPDIKNVFNALGTMASTIWHKLFPSVAKLWKAIKPLVQLLAVILVGALKLVVSVLSNTLGPALKFIIDIISNVTNIIADVIQPFMDLFKLLKDLFTGKWGKLWGDFKAIFQDAWNFVHDVLTFFGNFFSDIFGVVEGIVKGFVDGIVGFFKWLYNVLVGHSIIPDLMNAIVKWFKWIVAPVAAVMKAVWAAIKWAWDLIVSVFNTAWGWIKGVFKALWAGIKAIVVDPIIAARDIAKSVWDHITGFFSGAWSWASGTFRSLWNAVKSIVSSPITGARDVIKSSWDHIVGYFSNAWDWIKNVFSKLWSGIRSILESPFSSVKSFITGVFSGLWGAIKSAFYAFKSSLGGAWDALKGIFGAPIRFLVSGVIDKGILGAWNWLANAIPGMSGLSAKEWHPTFGGYTFSKGGILPGYAPGKDRVPAMLSPGEAVLVPEVVRALGASQIHKWNKEGVRQRGGGTGSTMVGSRRAFSVGGILDNLDPTEWFTKFKKKIGTLGGNLASHVAGGTAFGSKLLNVPGAAIGKATSSVWNWLKSLPGKLIQKAWNKIQDWLGLTGPNLSYTFGGVMKGMDLLIADVVTGKNFDKDHGKSLSVPGLGLQYSTYTGNRQKLYDAEVAKHAPGFAASNKYRWTGPQWGYDDIHKSHVLDAFDWGTGYVDKSLTWRSDDGRSLNGLPSGSTVRAAMMGKRHTQRGMHLVGENGPELLHLPYGSRVYNNSYTSSGIADMAGRVAYRIAAAQPGTSAHASAGPVTNNTTNNSTRNVTVKQLVLPNITSPDDAEELLRNLESLGDGSL